jgi:hypothetical protein
MTPCAGLQENAMTDTTTQELADKQAIRELQVLYAYTIDAGAYDDLDKVFTPEAVADYGRAGHITGLEAIKGICRDALEPLTAAQHLNASHHARIHGDTATASCYLNVHLHRDNTPGGDHLEMGGRYDDQLVRTDDGWKIKHRKLTILWSNGNPDVRW